MEVPWWDSGPGPGRGFGERSFPEDEAKFEICSQFLTFFCIKLGFNE